MGWKSNLPMWSPMTQDAVLFQPYEGGNLCSLIGFFWWASGGTTIFFMVFFDSELYCMCVYNVWMDQCNYFVKAFCPCRLPLSSSFDWSEKVFNTFLVCVYWCFQVIIFFSINLNYISTRENRKKSPQLFFPFQDPWLVCFFFFFFSFFTSCRIQVVLFNRYGEKCQFHSSGSRSPYHL